jgi:hypothetical protein
MEKSDIIHVIPFIGIAAAYLLLKYMAVWAMREPFARVECLHQNTFSKIHDYSIIEELGVTPCKHTSDGYCLRNEKDYCPNGECNCPHMIATTQVIKSIVTCETTVEVCEDCGEVLTEPKTDC